MKPYFEDNLVWWYNKDCRSMDELPDESVQCVITSPPYWGLRKYSGLPDLVWGDKDCKHRWGNEIIRRDRGMAINSNVVGQPREMIGTTTPQGSFCQICGAWKGSYGLEPTPEMYILHTIEILREIRRVLRKDGVVFWNCGDSYWGGGQGGNTWGGAKEIIGVEEFGHVAKGKHGILKPKDLCLIPFRVAIEAQKPYQEFTIKELSDRAWLAGIVDADGTIGIHHLERDDRGNHYHQFQPFLAVGSSDLAMIERCVAITRYGGSRQKTEPNFTDNRGVVSKRTHYDWRLEGEKAIKIIQDIYPHLIVKEKQARIAYELYSCHSPHTGKGHRVPEDITNKRLSLWNLCKACNQREDVDVNFPPVPQHIEQGWWVRSVIIWSKPNPMPESVTDRPTESHEYILMLTKSGTTQYWIHRDGGGTRQKPKADYRWVNQLTNEEVAVEPTDWKVKIKCPECEATGIINVHLGLDVWQETKCPTCNGRKETQLWKRINLWRGHDYYWDADAVREPIAYPEPRWGKNPKYDEQQGGLSQYNGSEHAGRNIRTAWEFPTQPYPEAHFAVFPEKLPEICIKAATPEVGCCSKCGAPWERIVSKKLINTEGWGRATKDHHRETQGSDAISRNSQGRAGDSIVETLGWQPTCKCNTIKPPIPSIILDPFLGSGTTLWVAKKLGRRGVGYELSEEYCALALERNRQSVMELKA